jgi:hypothetical protein
VLRRSGYDEEPRNDMANITLISEKTYEKKAEEPSKYLRNLYRADPALLKMHFVPSDETVWRLENYPEFPRQRRQLILQECRRLFTPQAGIDASMNT